jgi:hypothetical protein
MNNLHSNHKLRVLGMHVGLCLSEDLSQSSFLAKTSPAWHGRKALVSQVYLYFMVMCCSCLERWIWVAGDVLLPLQPCGAACSCLIRCCRGPEAICQSPCQIIFQTFCRRFAKLMASHRPQPVWEGSMLKSVIASPWDCMIFNLQTTFTCNGMIFFF